MISKYLHKRHICTIKLLDSIKINIIVQTLDYPMLLLNNIQYYLLNKQLVYVKNIFTLCYKNI